MTILFLSSLGLALVLTGVPSVSANGGDPHARAVEPCTLYDDSESLSVAEMAMLWSDDDDRGVATGDALRKRCGYDPTPAVQLASTADISFRTPPSGPSSWNRESFDRYAPETSPRESYAPTTANLSDWRFVKDAHATIYSLGPSTVLHRESRNTTHYAAPSGRINAIVDYRVEVPRSEGVPQEPSPGESITFWTLESEQVETVRLLIDGQTIRYIQGTHSPSFEYALPDETKPTSVTIEADISVTLRVEVWQYRCRSVQTTNHMTHQACFWEDRLSQTRQAIHTVQDRRMVVPYRVSAPVVHGARFSNGSTELRIAPNGSTFSRLASLSQNIEWRWGFYVASDRRWAQLSVTTADGTAPIERPLHPLQVHAYPLQRGVDSGVQPGSVVHVEDGPELEAPQLGSNVSVPVVESPFANPDALVLRYQPGKFPETTSEIVGLVSGVDQVERRVAPFETVQRTQLSSETLVSNETHALIEVTLHDERGQPISLAEREGTVTVNGQQFSTNTSGRFTATVERSGFTTVRYRPALWYRSDPSYEPSRITVHHRPTGISGSTIQDGLGELVVWLFPWLVLLYALDAVGSADVWPSWKLWRP